MRTQMDVPQRVWQGQWAERSCGPAPVTRGASESAASPALVPHVSSAPRSK